jgi:hypothetical protein
MTLDEYIALFAEEVAKQLPDGQAREVSGILLERNPRRVFLVLDRLREAGSLHGTHVEQALTDFYWDFCY